MEDQLKEDLRMASELGQLLVEKQTEHLERIQSLERELEETKQDLVETGKQLAEERRMRFRVDSERARLELELQASLETEAEARAAIQRAHDKGARKAEQEADERLARLQEEVASSQSAVARLREREQKLNGLLQEQERRMDAQAAENVALRASTDELGRVRALNHRLEGQLSSLGPVRKQLEESQWENEQLGRTIRLLESEVQHLKTSLENVPSRTSEAEAGRGSRRPSVAAAVTISLADDMLTDQDSESPKSLARSRSSGSDVGGDTAAALGGQQQPPEQQPPQQPTHHVRGSEGGESVALERRRREESASNAQREFFFLSVAAVKLNMQARIQVYCRRSNRDLYDEAVRRNIPFHQYQAFIEGVLMRDYIAAQEARSAAASSRSATCTSLTSSVAEGEGGSRRRQNGSGGSSSDRGRLDLPPTLRIAVSASSNEPAVPIAGVIAGSPRSSAGTASKPPSPAASSTVSPSRSTLGGFFAWLGSNSRGGSRSHVSRSDSNV